MLRARLPERDHLWALLSAPVTRSDFQAGVYCAGPLLKGIRVGLGSLEAALKPMPELCLRGRLSIRDTVCSPLLARRTPRRARVRIRVVFHTNSVENPLLTIPFPSLSSDEVTKEPFVLIHETGCSRNC